MACSLPEAPARCRGLRRFGRYFAARTALVAGAGFGLRSGSCGPTFMPMARSKSPLHIGPTNDLSENATLKTSSFSLRHQAQPPGPTLRNSTVMLVMTDLLMKNGNGDEAR